jgi:hypothetical protein
VDLKAPRLYDAVRFQDALIEGANQIGKGAIPLLSAKRPVSGNAHYTATKLGIRNFSGSVVGEVNQDCSRPNQRCQQHHPGASWVLPQDDKCCPRKIQHNKWKKELSGCYSPDERLSRHGVDACAALLWYYPPCP